MPHSPAAATHPPHPPTHLTHPAHLTHPPTSTHLSSFLQSCFLSMAYCCSGPDPLSPTAPDPADWPPGFANVSWAAAVEGAR